MIAKNIFSKILFFLGILIFTSCVSDDVVFNQVGYFKDDMKNRVFTFRIISQKASFSSDSIPQNVLNKIEEHGKSQMHTARQITNCYYFLENAPDVTMKDDFFSASSLSWDSKPLVWVSIKPTGEVDVSVKPNK